MFRVLTVDDSPAFRRTVQRLLKPRADLQIIDEASDGREAVQKAEELQPDLILLDIGLPRLNGIEAARQITKLAPQSKILFLSIESSADVVQEALSLGAQGYVLKLQAGKDLVAAVEAALQGKIFISSGLLDPEFPPKADVAPCHKVQFYSDDASFLDGFAHFIGDALKRGDAAIVIATEAHQASLLRKLQTQGLDVSAAKERSAYISVDVAEALSTFMVDDWPDPDRFLDVVGGLVSVAVKGGKGEHPRVAACGECAPVLLGQGKANAAIRLEQLWDGVARTYDADILCGYSISSFRGEEGNQLIQKICAEHSAVCSR